MSEYKTVLGSLFGDEGKGMTVNWLCKQAIAQGKTCAVVRYCGGPQAGHTVIENGIKHVFSSFGSGTLLGVPTIYTYNGYIDPICLFVEYEVLNKKGITPIFDVSDARLITPYDVIANRQDVENLKHGTCGKGVYKAVKRSESGICKHFYQIKNENGLLKFLKQSREYHNIKINKELEKHYINCFGKIKYLNFNYDSTKRPFDVYIYEGTQGLLLDANKGFLPHVTATSVIPDGFAKDEEVYLICRSYLTRHGNYGNTLKLESLPYQVKHDYTNEWNKFQGSFNIGLFNIDLLKEAIIRHEFERINTNISLVITHCDDIRENYSYVVNNNIKEGNLNTLVKDIQDSIPIFLKHIYTNSSEESNLTIYQ